MTKKILEAVTESLVFDCNSPQTLSNFISLTTLITLKFLTMLQLKISEDKLEKRLKCALLCNYFSDLFIEVKICIKSISKFFYDFF